MNTGFDEHGRLRIVRNNPEENTDALRRLGDNPDIVAEQHILDLRWVPLASLPIEYFSQLKALYLHENQLTVLPELDHFPSLQLLSLGKNQLTALPRSIKEIWMSLQFLFLGENQIQSLPFLEEEMMIAHGSIGNNPLLEPIGDRWMLRSHAQSSIAALHLLSRSSQGIPHDIAQEQISLFVHNCTLINEPMIFSHLLEGYRWIDGEGLRHEEHQYINEINALTSMLDIMGPQVMTHFSIGQRLVHRPEILASPYWFSS